MNADGLAIVSSGDLAKPVDLRGQLEAFLARRSANTIAGYRGDLADFARWRGVADPLAAIMEVVAAGQGVANATVEAYLAALKGKGKAAATVNRRLAAVKCVVRLARKAGLITWGLEVEGDKAEDYRDTRGPGAGIIDTLLKETKAAGTPKGKRDHALLRVAFDLGLRRAELTGLDYEHLDLNGEGARVSIHGKGRAAREWLTLPPETVAALRVWLEERGTAPGPLFYNFHRNGRHGRLTPDGFRAVLAYYGKRHGVRIRPHGLRHSAITRVAELTGGNIADIKAFSRHRKADTAMRYIDNAKDNRGRVAALLAATVGG